MIAHTQTHVGTLVDWDEAMKGDVIPGNCMQTAIASLLDLPLDAVPHFALFGYRWGGAMNLWFRYRGKKMRAYSNNPADIEFYGHWSIEHHALEYAPSDQMMIAIGPSFGGPWMHAVLWKAGELVHDPHPSHRGLAGRPTEFWQITDVGVQEEN